MRGGGGPPEPVNFGNGLLRKPRHRIPGLALVCDAVRGFGTLFAIRAPPQWNNLKRWRNITSASYPDDWYAHEVPDTAKN